MKHTCGMSILALFLLLLAIAPVDANTTQTNISVHVLAKGAKFIGDGVGGARVTITDAETGEKLSQGTTSGHTGNTTRIMRDKHKRNGILSTTDAADYNTSLWLAEPTRIKVTAYGPLNHEDDANTASITTRVLPGKDLTGGDGVLLEIPGFVVDLTEPDGNWFHGESTEVTFKANVTMMCGCPITPDGLWDARDYDISVNLYKQKNMEPIDEVPMSYAGEPSQFEATVNLPEPGCYVAVVQAHDPATGNTGYEQKNCHLME